MRMISKKDERLLQTIRRQIGFVRSHQTVFSTPSSWTQRQKVIIEALTTAEGLLCQVACMHDNDADIAGAVRTQLEAALRSLATAATQNEGEVL